MEKLARPVTGPHSTSHSFITVSDDVLEWLNAAYSEMQKCSVIRSVKESEDCVRRHRVSKLVTLNISVFYCNNTFLKIH